MLWGARHAGASFAGILELVTEHADFFFISGQRVCQYEYFVLLIQVQPVTKPTSA